MGHNQFLNSFELQAFEMMQPVGRKHNCHFFPKVKLGDVLELRRSGLEDQCFDYAARAHFDFVAVQDNRKIFAIELDGPGHYSNDTTPDRDAKKNNICAHFDFDLVRIDLGYLNDVNGSHVLQLRLHDYFNRNNPKYKSKLNSGGSCNYLNSEWELSEPSGRGELQTQVHETTSKYRSQREVLRHSENDFEYVALVLQVEEERYCVGQGSAHPSRIFGLNAEEIAARNALIELERRVSQYEQGKQPAKSSFYVQALRSAYGAPETYPSVRKIVIESYTSHSASF
ncbi:MAG: DUF2726 domain-containing protein [Cyanobacteria bacterium SZAS LIN-5]|nr:DUF2726 domain-containing protein [Cyanobacteria bacterium SZAS LIN-5]